jgi:hypothetical protein
MMAVCVTALKVFPRLPHIAHLVGRPRRQLASDDGGRGRNRFADHGHGIVRSGFWLEDPQTGADWRALPHGERVSPFSGLCLRKARHLPVPHDRDHRRRRAAMRCCFSARRSRQGQRPVALSLAASTSLRGMAVRAVWPAAECADCRDLRYSPRSSALDAVAF